MPVDSMMLNIVTPRGPSNSVAGRSAGEPLRFPGSATTRSRQVDRRAAGNAAASASARTQSDQPRDPAGEVLAVFADVSRRINDLARDLKCLGYFDDDSDRPRAA